MRRTHFPALLAVGALSLYIGCGGNDNPAKQPWWITPYDPPELMGAGHGNIDTRTVRWPRVVAKGETVKWGAFAQGGTPLQPSLPMDNLVRLSPAPIGLCHATWHVSSGAIDDNGTFTAPLEPGQVTITATRNGQTARDTFEVIGITEAISFEAEILPQTPEDLQGYRAILRWKGKADQANNVPTSMPTIAVTGPGVYGGSVDIVSSISHQQEAHHYFSGSCGARIYESGDYTLHMKNARNQVTHLTINIQCEQ